MTCQGCGAEVRRNSSLQKYCAACSREATLRAKREFEARWRAANPEESKRRIAAAQAKRDAKRATPEHKDRVSRKACADCGREFKRTSNRQAWCPACGRERKLALKRAAEVRRKDRNPDHVRELARLRIARRRARHVGQQDPIPMTPADLQNLKDRQGGFCAGMWCLEALDDGYHVDHVIPLSKGGAHAPGNAQLLCPKCNRSKGSKLPDEFVRFRERTAFPPAPERLSGGFVV